MQKPAFLTEAKAERDVRVVFRCEGDLCVVRKDSRLASRTSSFKQARRCLMGITAWQNKAKKLKRWAFIIHDE
jgi:hypothetical protein